MDNNKKDEFGGIDLNQRRENKGLDIPNLDKFREEAEAKKEVQRRADEMARNMIKEENDRQNEIDKMKNKLRDKMIKRKKVIKRKKTIIAIAVIAIAIATGIATGIAIAKAAPKSTDNLPTATQETTQHEVTLDELKATLDAGYSEVQINGHWYGTKAAIESMEKGVPLDASKSIDQMTQDNINENNKTR